MKNKKEYPKHTPCRIPCGGSRNKGRRGHGEGEEGRRRDEVGIIERSPRGKGRQKWV
jgi:hypothetical protein